MTDFTFQTNPFQTFFIYVFYDTKPPWTHSAVVNYRKVGGFIISAFYHLSLISAAPYWVSLNTDLGVG